MDRGLAVVITILIGAALGLFEACSGAGDVPRPAIARDHGAVVSTAP